LKGTQKIWDSSLAGIGMLWAKSQGSSQLKRYTDITFERFWRRELDIEDIEVVVNVLKEAGVSVGGFDSYEQGQGRSGHDELQEEILDKGYFGVPTYVIDGESYFGREHLPRVRWHLSGCGGPIPDVAYDTILNGSDC